MALDWREQIEAEIESFRSLPRAPGRFFLDADGRLSQDAVESYYEIQEEPAKLGERPAWERRLKV